MSHRHNLIREGVIAGVIGATAVAVWFFGVDVAAGRPLATPAIMGEGLLGIFGMHMQSDTQFMHVALYTVFHYAAFVLLGVIVVAVVHQADKTPGVLAGLLIMFVVVQLGAWGFTALFMETPLGGLAWYNVFLANIVASVAMGWFIWRRHPRLGGEFRQALEGTDEPLESGPAPPAKR